MKNKKNLSFIFKTVALLSFLTFVTNKIVFALSTMKERLYSINKNYFSWKFGNIYYTVKGSGSPILLIHDLNCTSSSYEWHEVIESLSQEHTVYAIDLLGCGRSDKPKITYTNYLYVQLINDFIKTVIKHKTTVMITGSSCTIAIMSCYIEPQLFENIILVNPQDIVKSSKCPTRWKRFIKYIIELPLLGTFIYNIVTCEHTIKHHFQVKCFYEPGKLKKRFIESYCEGAHLGGSSSKYLFSSTFAHYTNINIIHALKQINNNIYIIMGEGEPKKDGVIESYIQVNPSIETEVIPKTKHLPQVECPEAFISVCEIYI